MNTDRRSINEEELQAFFTLIGSGIWYLQHVENALNTCITIKVEIKEVGAVDAATGEKLLAKHRRNTLGTSIRIAKEKGVLSSNLMAKLDAFKEERDWLVHRSMNQNGDDLYVNINRFTLLNRLHQFSEDAKELQKLIVQELEDFGESKGVSREWIHEQSIADIKKKKGLA